MCEVHVTFEDVLLGEPLSVQLSCSESSRLFPYYLRQQLHALKRVPPFKQSISKLSDGAYSLKIRDRPAKNLIPYTIHGHYFDEYEIFIDKKDTVMDVKFLLAPLVNHGNKAEDIRLNFNTVRGLQDDEIFYDTKCVGDKSIVVMFWFEFTNPNEGETSVIQSTSTLLDINPLYPDIARLIRSVCAEYRNDTTAQTFGSRKYVDKNDLTKRGEFEFITYNTLINRIDNISVALRNILGLVPGSKTTFGLCSVNRREWLLCDWACSVSSIVTVPLYPTLSANAFEFITNHAEIQCIATDSGTLPQILELLPQSQPHLKHIILMDDELPDQLFIQSSKGKEILSKYKNVVHVLSDLEKQARDGINSGKYAVEDVLPSSQDVWTIMYTSGTTGNPKGVMLTHHNIAACINSIFTMDTKEIFPLPDGAEETHLSYLPLAHIVERLVNLLAFYRGAKIGFFGGSADGIIESMRIMKSPMFVGVPRIFQRVQNQILNGVESKSWFMKKLFWYAYEQKKKAILDRKDLKGYIWDKIVFNKINQLFGGNIISVISASAPLSAELTMFLKICLSPQTGEAYGLTETSGSGTGSHPFDLTCGHVGLPRPCMSLKLVDVPDMNYMTTDKPYPRGEIWLKGPCIFKGYYKDPKKTAEVLGKDGWFKTGDIGVWKSEGRLAIIDRKKNIFKLSQGEYIRPEFIQNVYKGCNFVNNIFVYGNSYQNYLVGIIVPDFEALEQVDASLGSPDALKDKEKYAKIEAMIKKDLEIQATEAKLNGFEKVKKFRLFGEEFSSDNGLLTISMKLKRNDARKRFQKDIDEMYQIRSKM